MRIPYGFILASDGVLKINKDEADVKITCIELLKRYSYV